MPYKPEHSCCLNKTGSSQIKLVCQAASHASFRSPFVAPFLSLTRLTARQPDVVGDKLSVYTWQCSDRATMPKTPWNALLLEVTLGYHQRAPLKQHCRRLFSLETSDHVCLRLPCPAIAPSIELPVPTPAYVAWCFAWPRNVESGIYFLSKAPSGSL